MMKPSKCNVIKQKPRSNPKRPSTSRSVTASGKQKQMFSVIQSFHKALCCLPLDKLICSQNPQKWLLQQFSTHQHLKQKLQQASCHLHYQYYLAKLDSVEALLGNIGENLRMLNKIEEQRPYYSNSSSCAGASRGIYSCQGQYQTTCLVKTQPIENNRNLQQEEWFIFESSPEGTTHFEENSNQLDIANGLLSYDKYQIHSLYANVQNVQMQGNLQPYNFQKKKKSSTFQTEQDNLCQTQMKKYHESIKNLLTKRNSQNKLMNTSPFAQLGTLTTSKGDQLSNHQLRTKHTNTDQNHNPNMINFRFNESVMSNKNSLRNRPRSKKSQSHFESLSSSQQEIMPVSHKECTKRSKRLETQIQKQTERNFYLNQQLHLSKEQGYQLELRLNEKDNIIKELMAAGQLKGEQIKQWQEKLKEKLLECDFFAERVRILQNNNRDHQTKVQSYLQRERDLRQIIKRQSQRNQKLEGQAQMLQRKIGQSIQEFHLLRNNNDKTICQLSQLQKELRIQREKSEIYRQKYYQSLNSKNQTAYNPGSVKDQLLELLSAHRSQIQKLR